jgi:transcriptional pleiotropic regulator of transition state genes
MKATGIIRNIDELGRIVIPKEIRKKMDIKSNQPIEIYVDDNKIILCKYSPSCILCDGTENVTLFKGKRICQSCMDEIKG